MPKQLAPNSEPAGHGHAARPGRHVRGLAPKGVAQARTYRDIRWVRTRHACPPLGARPGFGSTKILGAHIRMICAAATLGYVLVWCGLLWSGGQEPGRQRDSADARVGAAGGWRRCRLP
jgi:hypothetical protein